MSVYIRHDGGVTQEKINFSFYEKLYKHREAIANDFNGKYGFLKTDELAQSYFSLSLNYIKSFNFKGVKFLIKALMYNHSVVLNYLKTKKG